MTTLRQITENLREDLQRSISEDEIRLTALIERAEKNEFDAIYSIAKLWDARQSASGPQLSEDDIKRCECVLWEYCIPKHLYRIMDLLNQGAPIADELLLNSLNTLNR